MEKTPRSEFDLRFLIFVCSVNRCYGNVASTCGTQEEKGNACVLLGNCTAGGFGIICVDGWRVKVTLSTPWRHIRGVQAIFWTSAIDGDDWSAPPFALPLKRTSGTPWTRGWVDPIAGLESGMFGVQRNTLVLAGNWTAVLRSCSTAVVIILRGGNIQVGLKEL